MPLRSLRCLRAFWLGLLALASITAYGSGPRWVTGPPYFASAGRSVIWYTDTPQYFTDPGPLSASVSHAAADAMVAAAASAWNVPTSRIALAQGGTLDEEISSANVYPNGSGLVFPADASASNYAAKQIAVVYDRDGSVTDLLLGYGASDPSGCLQNAVTEDVDSITSDGSIRHAVIILNGRCTGPQPERQLQMQYQLERIFGRVLGLAWSQLNDNVFTGSPAPNAAQVAHWPIMHPLDVICGVYTYQCLTSPFTLRDDDVAGLTGLYPVSAAGASGSKIYSLSQALSFASVLQFPTGEGMAGVNFILKRQTYVQSIMDTYYDVSAVSGATMQQQRGNPVSSPVPGIAGSMGTSNWVGANYAPVGAAGLVSFSWIPFPAGQNRQYLHIFTEPINPLYTGEYAIGPYVDSMVSPSGSGVSWTVGAIYPAWQGQYQSFENTVSDAASNCSTASEGTQAAPSPVAATGWWSSVLCGANASNSYLFTHTSWVTLPVKANRSFTVEVTALDELGGATGSKARPVLGLWSAEDLPGASADVSAPTAFNGLATGMTTVGAQTGTTGDTVKIAIADERGDGRPDYAYQARVLYADAITPAATIGGSTVTITGIGFRPGNAVTIGGVAATVQSWTNNTIIATVPFLSSVQSGQVVSEDVVVTDRGTGGSTIMRGALAYSYAALPYSLRLVSAPTGSQTEQLAVSTPFAVKALDVDGVTPMSGVAVVFSATTGSVQWSACDADPCTVLTDAGGVASISVTPQSAGAIRLQAAALGRTATAAFTAVPLVRLLTVAPTTMHLAAGATVSWPVTASALQMGLPAALAPIAWTAQSASGMLLGGLDLTTGADGKAAATVTAGPLAAGATAAGQACAWLVICSGFTATAVDSSQFVVGITSGAGQSVASTEALAPFLFTVMDGDGNPVAGASVTVHQSVSQWTAACPETGRCPDAPTVQQNVTTVVTDINGTAAVAPLQIAGAEVTDVVATSGARGFVSLAVQKHP
ncbi:MAG TPA: IPT/TIG domain-containing protein [Granulicella sp.]